MGDVNLFKADLGNLPESTASVANNLIDKISGAIGWSFSPKGLEISKNEAIANIIKEISERKDLDPFARIAFISNSNQIIKHYKNNADIINIALENVNSNAKPENIDDDWLSYFFDKAKNISSYEMKIIWGKILAEEANEPNSISKSLIHIMSIMSKEDANRFMSLIPFCFDTDDNEDPIALVTLRTRDDIYVKSDVSYYNLVCCERLGLITMAALGVAFASKRILITYGNKKCILSASEKAKDIRMGDVSLTIDGMQLVRICERIYHDNIFEYCLKKWEELGVNIEE